MYVPFDSVLDCHDLDDDKSCNLRTIRHKRDARSCMDSIILLMLNYCFMIFNATPMFDLFYSFSECHDLDDPGYIQFEI